MKPTGKTYKCIGLKESMCVSWNHCFTVGELYEQYADPLKEANIYSLYLKSDFNDIMYAEKTQFVEVKHQSLQEILNELNITTLK